MKRRPGVSRSWAVIVALTASGSFCGCSGGTSEPGGASAGSAGAGSTVSAGTGSGGQASQPATAGMSSAGSSVMGGSAGTGSGAAGGGSGGAAPAVGGTAGTSAGSGGATGGGGAAAGGTGGAAGPSVTAPKGRHEHTFRAKDADADVSFNDNSEIAVVDNRAPILMGKLVLPFGGVGTNAGTLAGGGEFCARRGFHVLGVAAFQDYDILSNGADFFGDARRSVFEGVLYTHEGAFAGIAMKPADGVAQRTQKALKYLQTKYPEEGWGYFLEPDGSVRWSDVIFSGISHGGSNAARFAFLVEASRVVSLSAPRENLCTRLDVNDCGGVVATWLSEKSKTPMERFFAITGKSDEQHLQHLFTMEKTGYSGAATPLDGAQPPYGNTHRLIANAGHTDFCDQASYQAACNYVFGVPAENQAGTR